MKKIGDIEVISKDEYDRLESFLRGLGTNKLLSGSGQAFVIYQSNNSYYLQEFTLANGFLSGVQNRREFKLGQEKDLINYYEQLKSNYEAKQNNVLPLTLSKLNNIISSDFNFVTKQYIEKLDQIINLNVQYKTSSSFRLKHKGKIDKLIEDYSKLKTENVDQISAYHLVTKGIALLENFHLQSFNEWKKRQGIKEKFTSFLKFFKKEKPKEKNHDDFILAVLKERNKHSANKLTGAILADIYDLRESIKNKSGNYSLQSNQVINFARAISYYIKHPEKAMDAKQSHKTPRISR